ncbi:MAG: TonB-dependent receptor plug domain-containing protein, partial [Flavobacteriales bacterium]|nr:TonB-dependent receptor plug domain-containing protein [Flavobacteriales bacterium]
MVTITDASSGQPLEMVTISSTAPRANATTNGSGKADVSALKGAEQVFVRMLGFETDTLSFSQLIENEGNLKLRSVGLSLDQVVVSATRWNQSKREVPGRISSISTKEVKLQSPQTAADMIGASGEVFIQKSQQGGGSPMIRGFATNRLLLVVDGVRMNTAIFRSGNVQNIINIDPFSVERAEVFFGPGSVIYGSDAIGGVMSFKTYEPTLSLVKKPTIKGNAVFRYSSASTEVTGHFDVNVGWKKWALLTSVTYTDYGDLKMGSNGPEDYLRPYYVERQGDSIDVVVENRDPLKQVPTAYSQINVMQKIRYSPNDKWNFIYGFHYSSTSAYGRYDRHLRERNNIPRYTEWNYGPQLWMMNNLEISNKSETTIYSQMNIRLAHQQFEESRISRVFKDPIRAIREEKVQAYSLNIDFKKNIGKQHQVFYGIEGIFNDVFSKGKDENIETGSVAKAASRYPRSNWSSMGAYLTYRYKPSKKIALQGGARYNQFLLNAKFDTTFFPFPFTSARINHG